MRGVDLSLGRGAARVHILRGFDLAIGKGEAVGIVGASGSGKSTLLMIMAGLERPDKGEVEIDGVKLGGLNEDALARFRGQRIGVFGHRPVVAGEAVRSRIAGNAGVDDLDVPAFGPERRFKSVGKRLAGWQTISSGQAVAQGDEAKRARRHGVRDQRQDRCEGQRLDEETQMPI